MMRTSDSSKFWMKGNSKPAKVASQMKWILASRMG